MIKGAATMTVTHETLVVALQEYLLRHFAVGSCPTLQEVLGNEARPTNMEYVGGTLATTVAERDDNERVCLRFERVRQLEKTGAICF